MVPIKSIKTTSCPVCGCTTIVLESIEVEVGSTTVRTHCFGGQWETRKFACGYEVQYTPNFGKERKVISCKNDPKLIAIKQKTKDLKENILDMINGSDLPDYIKSRFSDNIQWIK